MPAVLSRADTLREYLTGAGADGASQTDPGLSWGRYRSATEAVSLGIQITNPISGVMVDFASGSNPSGPGTLTAVDTTHLSWQPYGATLPGPQASFSGTLNPGIVEGPDPGQYLRLRVTTPLTPGSSTITLSVLDSNVFGMTDLSVAQATSGLIDYRSTIIRNDSTGTVTDWFRWLIALADPQNSSVTQLGSSGSGQLVTTGTFAGWPDAGWVQIRSSIGTLTEVVYYNTRTDNTLAVPSWGRGLLGTTAVAGSSSDFLYSVPGIAVGLDPAGVVSGITGIQTTASVTTMPTGVTWNLELTSSAGLTVPTIPAGQQFGVWIKRHIPAGALATPRSINCLATSFRAV